MLSLLQPRHWHNIILRVHDATVHVSSCRLKDFCACLVLKKQFRLRHFFFRLVSRRIFRNNDLYHTSWPSSNYILKLTPIPPFAENKMLVGLELGSFFPLMLPGIITIESFCKRKGKYQSTSLLLKTKVCYRYHTLFVEHIEMRHSSRRNSRQNAGASHRRNISLDLPIPVL